MMEQGIWRTEGVEPGMSVYTSDDVLLGTVKTVREHDFIVDRDLQRDIVVAVTMVIAFASDNDRLTLELSSDEAEAHDWEHPALI